MHRVRDAERLSVGVIKISLSLHLNARMHDSRHPLFLHTLVASGVISVPLNFPELQSRIQSGPSLISDRKKNRRGARKSRTMPGNSTADGGGYEPSPTPEYPPLFFPSFSPSLASNVEKKFLRKCVFHGQDTFPLIELLSSIFPMLSVIYFMQTNY